MPYRRRSAAIRAVAWSCVAFIAPWSGSAWAVVAEPEPEPVCPGTDGATHQPCPDRCVFGGEHKIHTQNLVGLKGLALVTIAPSEGAELEPEAAGPSVTPHFGASFFYEREAVENWLEIELNVAVLSAPGGVLLPVDLLLKKPFHAGRHVTAYVGLGPALEIEILDGTEVFGGLTGATGLYVWVTKNVGVDIELDYTLIVERGAIAHGLGGGVGPVFHF